MSRASYASRRPKRNAVSSGVPRLEEAQNLDAGMLIFGPADGMVDSLASPKVDRGPSDWNLTSRADEHVDVGRLVDVVRNYAVIMKRKTSEEVGA